MAGQIPETRDSMGVFGPYFGGSQPMAFLLRLSHFIEWLLGFVARTSAWMFIACILVITFDVITRKVGFQIPGFGSTRLQELEWHLHGILLTTWLGFAYLRNAHVRIDIFVGGLSYRRKVWIELFGCVVMAAPYLYIALPYAHDFFMTSLMQNESSDAPTGLPYRWVIKFFLYMGFWGIALAVISVISRCVVVLFGPRELAEQARVPVASAL